MCFTNVTKMKTWKSHVNLLVCSNKPIDSYEFSNILDFKCSKTNAFLAFVITNLIKTMCFTTATQIKTEKTHVNLLVCWSPLIDSHQFLNISTIKSLKTNCFWEQVFKNHGFYQCRFLKLIEAFTKTYVFDHWNHWKVIKN